MSNEVSPIVPALPPVAARPVVTATVLTPPHPMELAGVARRDALWDLLLTLTVTLVFPFGLSLAAHVFASADEARLPPRGYLTAVKWLDAFVIVLLAMYLVRRHRLSSTAFGLDATALGRQVLWAGGTLAATYAVMIPTVLAIGLLATLFPALRSDLDHRMKFIGLMPLHHVWHTMLLLSAVAIHEEMLFRGLLIPYLRRLGCGWSGAIVLSAAVFAVVHVAQGWLAILQVFPVGLVLAVFFVLSRSLLAVILAHFAFDFLQFQLIRVLVPWIEKNWPPA